MEKKQYDIPEVDVLRVESDVITQPSYGETEERNFIRLGVSELGR